MKITLVIVSLVLAAAVGFSASAKLRKLPRIVEGMNHVGVTTRQMPLLAFLEIAGGAGLLIGLGVATIGRLAAAGLVLYFVGAVGSHVRVKDDVATTAPASVLLALSVLALVAQAIR
jgi:hypothetical protein